MTGPAGSPEAQWQGVCWYRRRLRGRRGGRREQVLLRFEGAMNVAEVWLDGERIGGHLGGYLPFVLDLERQARSGPRPTCWPCGWTIATTRSPGPSRWLSSISTCTTGSIGRCTWCRRIGWRSPIPSWRTARRAAGSWSPIPRVSRDAATVRVQTHVRNGGAGVAHVPGAGHARAAATAAVAATALSPAGDARGRSGREVSSRSSR